VGKLFSSRIGSAFVIGETMRNTTVCGLVLILGFTSFCLAQMSPDEALQQIKEREAAQQDASQSPTTIPSADFTAEEVAKAHYARQVADAKRDYMTAVIKADETYVASLDAAMKQAMADRNLDLAEKLDAERKDGIARTAQHRALLTGNGTGADVGAAGGTDLNGYRLVKATWYVPGGNDRPAIDVTERIKPILRDNTGDVQASIKIFSDPQWGPHKELRIDYLRPNGLPGTITVREDDNIPKFDLPWDIPADQSKSPTDETLIPTGQ
jgi:hypothetical protein